MSAHSEAQSIADQGEAAGRALWAALEHSGIAESNLLHVFEVALETIADERMGSHEETVLWFASAMKSVPLVKLDGPSRMINARRADRAWQAFVDAAREDEDAQAYDHRRRAKMEAA